MKKFVFGLIVGAVLMLPVAAFGEEISKIGKRITAEFPVFLDGEELPVKAVALEGTSYAPVRVIAESLGLQVEFVDRQVILSTQKDGDEVVEEKTRADEIREEISKLETAIKNLEEFISDLESKDVGMSEEHKQSLRKSTHDKIKEHEDKIAELQKELDDLEAAE